MQKIEINRMENAYGIKKLVVNVDNSNTLFQDVIYSKNGIFKTSFSTCFYYLSNNDKQSVRDRISDVDSLININILKDGIATKNLKNKFIVFSREIYERHYIKLASYEEELELLTTKEEDKEYIRKLIASATEGPLKELKLKSEEIGLDFKKTMDLLGNEKLRYLDNIIHILKLINF